MMKILVFGKDGQLGKAFQKRFDLALLASVEMVNKPVLEYVGRTQCDLGNEQSLLGLLNQFKPNLIINASAYTAVDKAETEVDLAYAVNARAPEMMAVYAAQNDVTFLHYSTDYVFDGSKADFYQEEDVRNPLGVYGKSKAAGEEAIEKAFGQGAGGRYAIFRTSWVYGDGGNFIRTILRLAKERDVLNIIHDQYGVPTSADWLAQISLDLALDAHFQLKNFSSGIYHAVPFGETTWHGLATLSVQAAIDSGVRLKARSPAIKPILAVDYPLPAPRPMNSRMATDKLRLALVDGQADDSNSYNGISGVSSFPEWDGMVREYVSKLARDGLI